MLTELDHGLDAKNLETTATRQLDGSFILHTPRPGAAKLFFLFRPHWQSLEEKLMVLQVHAPNDANCERPSGWPCDGQADR